jgi:hypothetical protein
MSCVLPIEPAPATAESSLIGSVPFEHQGLARDFRRRVQAEELQYRAWLEALLRPVFDRLDRGHNSLRPHHSEFVKRHWDTMPHDFLLGATASYDGKRLKLTMLRVYATKNRERYWSKDNPDEDRLWIGGWFLQPMPKYQLQDYNLGQVSLHALGRRYQRSINADERADRAILRDLAVLADPVKSLDNGRIARTKHGYWIGNRLGDGFSIRTYIDDDSIDPDDPDNDIAKRIYTQ